MMRECCLYITCYSVATYMLHRNKNLGQYSEVFAKLLFPAPLVYVVIRFIKSPVVFVVVV